MRSEDNEARRSSYKDIGSEFEGLLGAWQRRTRQPKLDVLAQSDSYMQAAKSIAGSSIRPRSALPSA